MSNQFAVSIQNGDIIALVAYHYPKPLMIDYNPYHHPPKYYTNIDGVEAEWEKEEDLLAILEQAYRDIHVPAAISNIVFLKTEYYQGALKIYGNDLLSIRAELAKIPHRTYESAEELMEDCMPTLD